MLQVSRYSSINFDNDWKLGFQIQAEYCQKFATTDKPRVQYVVDSDSLLKPYLSVNGQATELQPTTLSQSDEAEVKELVIDLSSIPVESEVTLFFAENTSSVHQIEAKFLVTNDIEYTVLIEYTNRRNEYDTIFDTDSLFQFRVEGSFLPQDYSFESQSENFRDQRHVAKSLSGYPIEKKTLSIGGGFGVPRWVASLINNIFSLSNVYVNGEKMVRDEGGSVEMTLIHNDYPLYIYKITLETSDEITEALITLFRAVDSKKKVARSSGDGIRTYNEFAQSLGISDARMIRELATIEAISKNFYIEIDDGSSTNTGKANLETLQKFIFDGWIDQPVRKSDSVIFKGITSTDYKERLSGWKIEPSGIAELLDIILRGDLKSINFSTGALGAGYFLGVDDNGDSYLEVDRMLVRKVAYFVELVIQRMSHVGGQIVLTPASMKCSKVEEHDTFYRCYFENTDGDKTITNDFVAGDQARCQTFNVKPGVNQNVSNTYYWRLVVAVGDDYIDLSKTDCDAGSTVPQADDEIVLLGNRTDATRQSAIVLASYGNDAPYFKLYRGINSYQLDGKEFLSFSHSQIKIIADELLFSTGESVSTVINGVKEEVTTVKTEISGVKTDLTNTKTELQGKIDGIQIGVRNLLLKSNVELDNNGYSLGVYSSSELFVAGRTYTAVVCYTLGDANESIGLYTSTGSSQCIFRTKGERIVESKTFVQSEATTINRSAQFYQFPSGTYGSKVHWAILVEGNKAPNMWVAAPEDIQAEVEAAQQAASDAQEAATAAQSDATEAKTELSQINSDSVISPVEKTALKQQQADIQAEYQEIIADATRYGISTSAYTSAYNLANTALTKYTASSPTYITVGSDYANIAAYYDARQTILNSIAAAAKKASDDAMQAAEDEAELAKWRAIGYSWNSGKPLWTDDPTFKEGKNGIGVYDNASSGSVKFTHEAKQSDSPVSDSEYNLKIVCSGGGSPNNGGFLRQVMTRANAVFVFRFIAKLPEGTAFDFNYNNFGTGQAYKWVTSNGGTGRFEEYICVAKCGATGSFSTIGYFSIWGTAPVTCYLAYAGAFDVTAGVSQADVVSSTVTQLSHQVEQDKVHYLAEFQRIDTEVSAIPEATKEQIENAVVNLQKGMRNLVRQGLYNIVGSTEYYIKSVLLTKELVPGSVYTIVLKATILGTQSLYVIDNYGSYGQIRVYPADLVNGFFVGSFEYAPDSRVTNHSKLNLYNYPSSGAAANPMDLEWVCLYEGDITDTAPDYFVNAPEDLNLEIDSVKTSVSDIEQRADSITLRVETTEENVTNIGDKVDNLKIGTKNLVSRKMMLKWNEKNSNIAEWGKDADGVYLGIDGWLLFESVVGGHYKDIFLGEGNYKANTQYVLSVNWKLAGAQDYQGLMFYIEYTDGSRDFTQINKDQTTLIRTDVVTAKGKTIKKIYSAYGTNAYRTLVYSLSLVEGNVIPLEIPTAEEDIWRSEVNLVDGGEEVTLPVVTSGEYNYKELIVPVLKPNTVYTVSVENIEMLAGSPVEFAFSLYDVSLKTEYDGVVLTQSNKYGLLITPNNFTAGKAYLLPYAGRWGSTSGNSVRYTGISLVEGFYPPGSWEPSTTEITSKISVLEGRIETLVTATDGMQQQMSGMVTESNFTTIFAEKKNELGEHVINSINVSTEGITIRGDKIQITGDTQIINKAGQVINFFGNSGEVFNINNGKFLVKNTGELNINNGVFKVTNTGAMTATSGTIGGFTIGSSYIGAAGNVESKNGFSLYRSFLKFRDEDHYVAIGLSTFAASTAYTPIGRFENTEVKGETASQDNVCLYLNATGCPETYQDAGKNYAIWIEKGHIYIKSGYIRTGALISNSFGYYSGGTVTPSKTTLLITFNNDITLSGSGAGNGHIIICVNTSSSERNIYGTVFGKVPVSSHRAMLLVYCNGWYAQSDKG